MFRMVLFGVPRFYLGTTDLAKAITGRSLALLVYLTMTGKVQDRAILADLLWDDLSEAQAKKNLRYVLYDLRQVLGDYLVVSRQSIAFNHKGHYWLDVDVFTSYLHAEVPQANPELYKEVMDLYQGDFLDGFYIQDAPLFEEWLTGRRRQLHTQAVQGFYLLSQEYIAQRQYELGLQLTQRLLTLEPWNEEAHRQQMRLLAYSGRRSAALAQYEICCTALATEYNATPLFETTQLYEEIRSGHFHKASENRTTEQTTLQSEAGPTIPQPTEQPASWLKPPSRSPSTIQVNWDAIPAPLRLFGRQQELARLEQWICTEGCRLISLTGLGGQGKSALAAEIVGRLADQTEDNFTGHQSEAALKTSLLPKNFDAIFWCSLAGISSFAQLIAYWWRWCGALAELTDLEWLAQDTPIEEQLAYLFLYLRQQRCLLVFDQVETILQPSVFTGAYNQGWDHFPELLRRMAESEHQSCLLIISREELPEFTHLTRKTSMVRMLALQGLTTADSVAMLRSHGFTVEERLLVDLAQQYAGLPIALTGLSAMHQHIPSSQLPALLLRDLPLFDELYKLCAQQFTRLSAPEQELLFWLTLAQADVPFDTFWQTVICVEANGRGLDTYQSLLRRSLIQLDPISQVVKLPMLILRYTMQYFIELIVAELLLVWQTLAHFAQPALPQSPIYEARMPQPVFAHDQTDSRQAMRNRAFAFYTNHTINQEQETSAKLPTLSLLRSLPLQALENAETDVQPMLPFVLLRRYQLLNPNATNLIQEKQNNGILLPIVHTLQAKWGVRPARKRLQELLAALAQDVEFEMTTAEANLRHLLACLDLTMPLRAS